MGRLSAGRLDVLPPGSAKCVQGPGQPRPVAVFNVGGNLFAVDELCPHRAGPLSEGKIVGATVECPWHRAQFDLATGEPLGGPAHKALATYPVIVENGEIWIEV